jgi:hypothetical protein
LRSLTARNKFTHFVPAAGDVLFVADNGQFAKVGVMADKPKTSPAINFWRVMEFAPDATRLNPDVSITFGMGLSPFRWEKHESPQVACG